MMLVFLICLHFQLVLWESTFFRGPSFGDVAASDLFTEMFPSLSKHNNTHNFELGYAARVLLEVGQRETVRNMWVSPLTCLKISACVFFVLSHHLSISQRNEVKAYFKPGSILMMVRAIFTNTIHILLATLPLGHFSDVSVKREGER